MILPVYFWEDLGVEGEGLIPEPLAVGWIQRDDAIRAKIIINPNESVSICSIPKGSRAWVFEFANRYNVKFVTVLGR